MGRIVDNSPKVQLVACGVEKQEKNFKDPKFCSLDSLKKPSGSH